MSALSRAKELYREQGMISLLKGAARFVKWRVHSVFPYKFYIRDFKNRIYKHTDAARLTSPDTVYSEEYYAKRRDDEWRADAKQIGAALDDLYNPNSVIDFGCAIGQHLEYFHNQEVDIHGVEGSEKALQHAIVPREKLEQFDLRDPYTPPQKYDLAICMEVAEHISERYANTLVDTVTEAAPIVLFTAATPDQGGTHHVNEQPRSYWIEKFQERGYDYDQDVVQTIRDEISLEVTTAVPENIFIFKQSVGVESNTHT